MSRLISDYKIRDAFKNEGGKLSELALRSKSIWGYDDSFIEACRPHIKVDEKYIQKWPVVVIEKDSELLGFYSLKEIGNEKRLDNLWIEPRYVRSGFGRVLFENAIERAKELNWSYFRLAGEPDAIPFYEKMGAKLIGKVQSRLGEDLFLPHMEFLIVSERKSENEKQDVLI
ncbi:MAG: GNAT family N-acetyltransferase [Nanoarchaeota archaeon]|nr:GNAT family N-acetyltransferase [Nanoarchaeota archaeon]